MQPRFCNTIWNVVLTITSLMIMGLSLVLVSYLLSMDMIGTGRAGFVNVLENQQLKCLGKNDSQCLTAHIEKIFRSYLSGSMILLGFETLETSSQRLVILKGYVFVIYMCYLSTQICNVFLALQCLRFFDLIHTATRKTLLTPTSLLYPNDFNIFSNTTHFLSDSAWKIVSFGLFSTLTFIGGLVFFKLTLDLGLNEALIFILHIALKFPIKFDDFFPTLLTKLSYLRFSKYVNFSSFLFLSYFYAIIRISFLIILVNVYNGLLKGFSHNTNPDDVIWPRHAKDGYQSNFTDLTTPPSHRTHPETYKNTYNHQNSNQNIQFEEESTAF